MAPPIDSPSADAATRGSLAGRVALVTGAARRTGRAIALALAEAGADVAVHCRESRREASEVVASIRAIGRRAELVQVELSDATGVEAAFGQAAEVLGGLDILVNNVGTIVWKDFEDLSADDWQTCLDGTLLATLNASRAALPFLRVGGFGRIVNILDADADRFDPAPHATAYKIGKKASWALTKTLAALEGANGVTANAVSPGTLEDSPTKPSLDQIPVGRYGTYADVIQAVLFLASERADYVTGAHLKVSGGYLI